MPAAAWLTLAVIVATIAVLATERVSAPLTVLGGLTILLLTGVIDTKDALSGFSNEAPITIAALYILAHAVRLTGVLDVLSRIMAPADAADTDAGRPRRRELVSMLAVGAGLSTVLYNTPSIGLLAPTAQAWARRTRRNVSWYLLPLNYAVSLGGLVTAIGTTTNVVVSGLLRASGRRPLSLLEITPIGLPVALAGLAVLVMFAPRIVPSRRSPTEQAAADVRSFTVEMIIPKGSALIARTVGSAGLRNLDGVYLVEVTHDDRTVAPVSPEHVLLEGARLTFAGNVARIMDLQQMPGLHSAASEHLPIGSQTGHRFFEAVISPNSSLVGSTLKEASFRDRYGAAVAGIHRAGARVEGKLGAVRLRAGDVLLLLANQRFRARWAVTPDFLTASPVNGAPTLRREKRRITAVIMVAFFGMTLSGLVNVLEASLVCALAVVVLGVLAPHEAKDAIDINIIVILAASFGLGNAVAKSGLASEIAHILLARSASFGDVGVLGAVMIATICLTQVITNNAAAIVMFPIAITTATSAGLNPRAFAIAVAIGASCSFLTPIAYQTNLMVQGIAGYRFGDFARLGWILMPTTIVLSLLLIPAVFPLS